MGLQWLYRSSLSIGLRLLIRVEPELPVDPLRLELLLLLLPLVELLPEEEPVRLLPDVLFELVLLRLPLPELLRPVDDLLPEPELLPLVFELPRPLFVSAIVIEFR